MANTGTQNALQNAVLTCIGLFIAVSLSPAQQAIRDRIVQPIDGAQVSVIKGNVRPWARAENDRGKVNDSFILDHVTMVFKPSQSQQSSLANLLQELQNRSSASYHQWLTPEQFGSRFGLSENDLRQVISWLENQGFVVDEVARSHMWIVFSGTAGQVDQAFHTEIHQYLVDNETYYANASDPVVPGAFADVVLGLRGLNNFRPRPRAVIRKVLPAPTSRFTSAISKNHYLAPDDWATIYGVAGLYGSGISGAGQTIAVVGQTDIYANDITAFRAAAGLAASDPTVILVPGSSDPGVSTNDLPEADLDLEWAGAIAPNATIIYVNSRNAFDSLQYTIDQGLSSVVSVTYGDCEPNWSATELAALAQQAEQANAEGMTILAASGDSGATDCDYPATPKSIVTEATHGLAVDVPASLPYVTGVGGTEFNEGSGNYWSSSNNSSNGSALSYIPETAWNDTSTTNGLAASGGGASIIYSKPSWQTGIGVPNDNARDVPDIGLDASPVHDGYLICSNGSCVNGFRESNDDLNVVGGTSAGAPILAAIVALINEQTNSATGQGNINYILYPLAAQEPGAFHDITTGNNEVPCQKGSKNCPNGGDLGYSAAPGYDQVTGLGSLDVSTFVGAWMSVTSTASQQGDFEISLSPAALSLAPGQSGSATVAFKAANGFGGSVDLSCTVGSTLGGTTCTVSPTSVSTGSATDATVRVTVPAASRAFPKFNHFHPWAIAAVVLLLVLLGGIPVHDSDNRLTFGRRRRRLGWSRAAGLLALSMVWASSGCGGGSTANTATTTGSSSSSTSTSTGLQVAPVSGTVTVTARAAAGNAGISHSVLLLVTIE